MFFTFSYISMPHFRSCSTALCSNTLFAFKLNASKSLPVLILPRESEIFSIVVGIFSSSENGFISDSTFTQHSLNGDIKEWWLAIIVFFLSTTDIKTCGGTQHVQDTKTSEELQSIKSKASSRDIRLVNTETFFSRSIFLISFCSSIRSFVYLYKVE